MWSFQKPTDEKLARFLADQVRASFTYTGVGATAQEGEWPFDFDHARNRVRLGNGDDAFQRGRCALCSWRHFPAPWTDVYPASAAISAGTTVAVLIHAMGIWWWNSARIVYTIDQSGTFSRYGFAYGTLPAHAERGEEQFLVEMDSALNVWYSIRSFSRPRMLAARIAHPMVRRLQQYFIRDSFAAMTLAVRDG